MCFSSCFSGSLGQPCRWLRLSTSVLKMTEKGSNQRAGLSAGVCWGSLGKSHRARQALRHVHYQVSAEKLEEDILPPPRYNSPDAVVPSDLLTFADRQIGKTYGLTLDSAFFPVSSASTMLKVPLLVSLFHVIISTK